MILDRGRPRDLVSPPRDLQGRPLDLCDEVYLVERALEGADLPPTWRASEDRLLVPLRSHR